MGSGLSRQGLPLPPPPSPRASRIKRTFSSFFFCGSSAASTSYAPLQPGDDLLVNSTKNSDPIVNEFQSSLKESSFATNSEASFASSRADETGVSSEGHRSAEEGLSKVEISNQDKCLSERRKELVPSHQLNGNFRFADSASTSYGDQSFTDPVSTHERANMDVSSGMNNTTNRDKPRIGSEAVNLGALSPEDGASVENHACELAAIHGSDSGSGLGSDSPVSFHSPSNDLVQEAVPQGLGILVSDREGSQRGGNVLHVDVVSISSNILSSTTADISSREARRNSRRLFWDAFSRRGSRRHSDSRAFLFSTDDFDDIGSHDRWLLDFSGDFFDDGFGGDSGYFGSRTHTTSERRRRPRSEIRERLRGGLDGRDRRTSICPSGLHPDGACSCESILMAEESSTRASISRIVMLAEALFEVLDEIHRQPMSLSLSMVSEPAAESVVDSFPVKNHKKLNPSESGEDVAQCYICLAEYEEGDKIRVLPCKHEFHMSCVDKWLKEIHGVCPLCRGDVREGFTEGSVSNSEISPL